MRNPAPHPSDEGATSRRILALDLPESPGVPYVGTRSGAKVADAVRDHVPGTLWVHGERGSGKTTAVARALGALPDEASAPSSTADAGALPAPSVWRLSAWPGLRFEELLQRSADFLLHVGAGELREVLPQRSSLDGKLSVLVQVLEREPVVLWWDDFQNVECRGDGAEEERREVLLSRLSQLSPAARGGWIIASTSPPPATVAERVPAVAVEAWSDDEVAALVGSDAPPASEVSADASGRAGSPFWALFAARGAETPSGDLVGDALAALSPAARELLIGLASFRRPASRGALRELEMVTAARGPRPPEGVEVPPEQDPSFLELARGGWVQATSADGAGPWRCGIPEAIREHVDRFVAGTPEERRHEIATSAAMVEIGMGQNDPSPWFAYRAHRIIFASGQRELACGLNSTFLQAFIQAGFLEIASRVLADTVENTQGLPRAVALGNRAMLHKNAGRYREALEVYSEAKTELEALGDVSNLARVLHQIGNTFYLEERYDEAIESYRRSAQLSSESGDRSTGVATQVQLANVLWACDRHDEALREYEQVLEELDEGEHGLIAAAVLVQVGQVHLQSTRFVEAEDCFRRAAEHARRTNDRRCLLRALRGRAVAAKDQLAYDDACAYYREAEDVAGSLGDLVEALDCQAARAEIECRSSRPVEAYTAILEARDTFLAIERSGVLREEDLASLRDALEAKARRVEESVSEETRARLDAAHGAGGVGRVGRAGSEGHAGTGAATGS